MHLIKEILQNYNLCKKETIYFLVISSLQVLLFLSLPKLAQLTYEIITTTQNLESFYFMIIVWGIGGALFSITWFGTEITISYLWLKLRLRKSISYREILFQKNHSQVVDFGTGKLIERFRRGTDAEVDIYKGIIELLPYVCIQGIGTITIFMLFVPEFLPIILVGFIFIGGIHIFLQKITSPHAKKENDLWEEVGRNATKASMEFLTIKIANKEKWELSQTKNILDKIPYHAVRVDVLNKSFHTILEAVLRFVEIGLVFYFGLLVIDGKYDITELFMLVSYIWFLWMPIQKLLDLFEIIRRQKDAYQTLQEFLKLENTITDGDKIFRHQKGKISFENISFRYDEKDIFENLNLTILAGKKNAFVGHSGSGKTTLIKLLLRLYDIQGGKIQIDDQDLKNLKIHSWYQHIGYLPQDPAIFDGTVRENLEYALGDELIEGKQYDENLIWDALKKSRLYDMIFHLPNGLETQVGEKGIKLSGGEKQRLAIARIFLKNPDVIILDEATSALDSKSEHEITESLHELMKGKTAIIIAHRLQTVMNADKIVVLEDGKILSEGTHVELIQRSSEYKELVELQNGRIIT